MFIPLKKDSPTISEKTPIDSADMVEMMRSDDNSSINDEDIENLDFMKLRTFWGKLHLELEATYSKLREREIYLLRDRFDLAQ